MTEPLVHVIDDDDAVRVSLGFVLEMADLPNRTYASPVDFLAQATPQMQGCIITDVRMPVMNGLELVARLREIGVDLPVIVITGHGDVALAVEALRAGVKDFIEKPFDHETLLGSVRSALAMQTRSSEEAAERRRAASVFEGLSGREREVLEGVVAGKLNKTIGFELGISPRTVEVYRAKMMSKTGATSLSELVRVALLAGF